MICEEILEITCGGLARQPTASPRPQPHHRIIPPTSPWLPSKLRKQTQFSMCSISHLTPGPSNLPVGSLQPGVPRLSSRSSPTRHGLKRRPRTTLGPPLHSRLSYASRSELHTPISSLRPRFTRPIASGGATSRGFRRITRIQRQSCGIQIRRCMELSDSCRRGLQTNTWS